MVAGGAELYEGDEFMPYKHSGEIGDLRKHLPLCDILNSKILLKAILFDIDDTMFELY